MVRSLRQHCKKYSNIYYWVLLFCLYLSSKGLASDSQKVLNALDCEPTVESSCELNSRLGLISFFHRNLPRLSILTAPLNTLRNAPDIIRVWTPEHIKLMRRLQELLVSSAVLLSVPNLHYSICAVMLQRNWYRFFQCSDIHVSLVMIDMLNSIINYLIMLRLRIEQVYCIHWSIRITTFQN